MRTASGSQFGDPGAAYQIKLTRTAGNAFIDGAAAFLLTEPAFCQFE